jgi:hypothetical protein
MLGAATHLRATIPIIRIREGGGFMALDYAWENLYKAVLMSMRDEGSLQDRLIGCFTIVHVLSHERVLPPDLQERFDVMMKAWNRLPDLTGTVGTVPTTLRKMPDVECLKWLEEILSIFIEVVEIDAKNK